MTDRINLKGLVISEPWISRILSGEKTWEMRFKVTSYRGPLAVIRKGSGTVSGMVDLVDCIPGQSEAEYGIQRHVTAFQGNDTRIAQQNGRSLGCSRTLAPCRNRCPTSIKTVLKVELCFLSKRA
jgi:hypothetical protein